MFVNGINSLSNTKNNRLPFTAGNPTGKATIAAGKVVEEVIEEKAPTTLLGKLKAWWDKSPDYDDNRRPTLPDPSDFTYDM